MTDRLNVSVGQTIDGEQLTALAQGGFRSYPTVFALTLETDLVAGDLAFIVEDNRFAIYWQLDDLSLGWRALSAVDVSEFHSQPAELAVPSKTISRANGIGVARMDEVSAAIGTGDYPAGAVFSEAADSNEGEDFWQRTSGGQHQYTAQSNGWVEVLLGGGGGSGGGMAFTDSETIGDVVYPHSPIGGGGGGSGELVSARFWVERGDEVVVLPGRGGEPTSTPTTFLRAAEGRAGQDSVVWLNRVEVARARGGAAGSNGAAEVFDRQLDGNEIDPTYGLGSGGGGAIVPPDYDLYRASPTAYPPSSWIALNEQSVAIPPKGGAGLVVPFGTAATREGTDEIVFEAGAGGTFAGGINTIRSGRTTDGQAAGSYGSVADIPPRFLGVFAIYAGSTVSLVGVSPGGVAAVTAAANRPTDNPVGSDVHLSSGGAGGSVWQVAGTATDDTYEIWAPAAGRGGFVFVKAAQAGAELRGWTHAGARLSEGAAFVGRNFFDTPPPTPTLTAESSGSAFAQTILSADVGVDRDFGDSIIAWRVRRRVSNPSVGDWEYLLQRGHFFNETDTWSAVPVNGIGADFRAITPDPISLIYAVRPHYGGIAFQYEAQTMDDTFAVSEWSPTVEVFAAADTDDWDTRALLAIPALLSTDYVTLDTIFFDRDAELEFVWTPALVSAASLPTFVGFHMLRQQRVGQGETTPAPQTLVTDTTQGLMWVDDPSGLGTHGDGSALTTLADIAELRGGRRGGVPPAYFGDGSPFDVSAGMSSNWIASEDLSITLPPDGAAGWHSFADGDEGIYLYVVVALFIVEGLPQPRQFVYWSTPQSVGTITDDVVFLGLPDELADFHFGESARRFPFQVVPSETNVVATSVNGVVDVAIENGELVITPPATNTGQVSDTVRLVGTLAHYETAIVSYPITIADDASFDFSFTGLPSRYDLRLGSTFLDVFDISPIAPALLEVVSNDSSIVSASGSVLGITRNGRAQASISLVPHSVGSTQIHIAASRPDYVSELRSIEVTVFNRGEHPFFTGLNVSPTFVVGEGEGEPFGVRDADGNVIDLVGDEVFLTAADGSAPQTAALVVGGGFPFLGSSGITYTLDADDPFVASEQLELTYDGVAGIASASIVVTWLRA